MWAFEWHSIEKAIRLKSGQPLFFCQFKFINPEKSFQIFIAKRTLELKGCIAQISEAVCYDNWTFSLFKAALEVRPERFLAPFKR